MQSGIEVDDRVAECFKAVTTTKKDGERLKYFICKVSADKSKIEVVKEVKRPQEGEHSSYEDFAKELSPNESAYAFYNYSCIVNENTPSSKIVFITWNPDTAPIKQKMLYSSSKDALTKPLVPIDVSINATSDDEVSEEAIFEKLNTKNTVTLKRCEQ